MSFSTDRSDSYLSIEVDERPSPRRDTSMLRCGSTCILLLSRSSQAHLMNLCASANLAGEGQLYEHAFIFGRDTDRRAATAGGGPCQMAVRKKVNINGRLAASSDEYPKNDQPRCPRRITSASIFEASGAPLKQAEVPLRRPV